MYYYFRLRKGMDLKNEIEKFVLEHNMSGVILCCVGCLSKLSIRLADGETGFEKAGRFEIVSVTGTLSTTGVHIHISVSDEEGNTIGGHLKNGCIVNTTAEICLLDIPDVRFKREFDESTGYKELVIE